MSKNQLHQRQLYAEAPLRSRGSLSPWENTLHYTGNVYAILVLVGSHGGLIFVLGLLLRCPLLTDLLDDWKPHCTTTAFGGLGLRFGPP